MIVVITSDNDRTADRVVEEVRRRKAAVSRFDIADFPRKLLVSARLSDGTGWYGSIKSQAFSIPLAEITSIYYRRPKDFSFPADVVGSDLVFARAEARRGLGGLLFSRRVRWVNHPSRVADAEFKPDQLVVAVECGLRVPPTALTNDPLFARDFCGAPGRKALYKPLSAANIVDGDDLSLVFTSPVSADEVDSPDVSLTMNLFQEWVSKSYDARVTVFGDRVFGVAIHADNSDAHLDWRIDYSALKYEPIDVPATVADAAREYLERFGLLYGAFDFAVAGNEWFFLECNANGQYGWIEAETGLPMTAALVDLLTGEGAHG